MPTNISVAIMAHRKREKYVDELLRSLDHPAEVVWDIDNDRWSTGSRALLAHPPEATYHLVLQDDAIVCKDLVAGLYERLEEEVPSQCPVCLYAGVYRKFIHTMNVEYFRAPFGWMVSPGILWGVGVLIPTCDISLILDYCKDLPEPNYDMRISRYYERVKQCGVWYPIPSLVDHRDGPSLVAGRRGGRRAWKFVGRDASALLKPTTKDARLINLIRSIED